MKNIEFLRQSNELNSPVEFVLIGTVGKNRAVVAKSKGAQLDLIAYAQKSDTTRRKRSTDLSFYFPLPVSVKLRPLSVDSLPIHTPSNDTVDNRASQYTLVWRGAARLRHIHLIEKSFNTRIEQIMEALEQKSMPKLEWSLSSVIDECHRATIRIKRVSQINIFSFWLIILVYLIAFGVFFIRKF